MIGALIGDLAAWTWEHDRECFYSHLVKPDAVLSDAGFGLLMVCDMMEHLNIQEDRIDLNLYAMDFYKKSSPEVFQLTEIWKDGLKNRNIISEPIKCILNIATDIVAGWHTGGSVLAGQWGEHWQAGEEETCLTAVADVITNLRTGATKDEAIKNVPFIRTWSFVKRPPSGNPDGLSPLSYAWLAWHCFYDSWDFVSALHNAMRCQVGNKAILGMLTGAFASAMYGCQILLLKRKYSNGNFFPYGIGFSQKVYEANQQLFSLMDRRTRGGRYFYAKNEARTNVEYHHWQAKTNIFDEIGFSDQEHRLIMVSAPTGWECRFGFYWDNGWFYIYRSGYLISRFKMKRNGGRWRIVAWELSGERPFSTSIGAFACALDRGCNIDNYKVYRICAYAEECRYFEGSLENPYSCRDDIKGKFWYGEYMFLTSNSDFSQWEEEADRYVKSLHGDIKKKFESYSLEQRAMLCYIEALFAKWCPMEDLSWTLDY